MSGSPQSEITSICEQWAERLQKLENENERIEYIHSVLPQLLADRQLWIRTLESVLAGDSYPDLRQATMFKDEMILYPNHRRLFSLRLFIYDSLVYTPIHDHNAWGVIGSVSGLLEIVRYRREDDGSDDRFARLQLEDRYLLRPGQTDVTHPLDAGIHQTGNPDKGASIMLSVYGNPIRRLYIHRFDLESQRVYRMYPPRMQKKKLAGRALDALTASGP
jgi:predicted metal-dependent enzyme (double-stranded beta helix superfamily)